MWVDLLRPTGAAISALDETDRDAILEKVTTFDTFTPDNDPRHAEHDFGSIGP